MTRSYVNNRNNYALNNINLEDDTTLLIILKIIPIFVIVFFGFLFKKTNSFSYCNLQGKLCNEPIVTINDKNIIVTSCNVNNNNHQNTNNSNYSKSAGFIAGFSILLIIIVTIFGYMAIFKKGTRIKSIIVILFSIITIVGFLVTNQKEIWKGNLEYVSYKGGADIFWGINISLLILLSLYIILVIAKGNMSIFLVVDFSIIVILLIMLIQVILYGIFRQKCEHSYDYNCVSTLEKIEIPPIEPKSTTTIITKPVITKPVNKFKVKCITTGIRHLDVNTSQIILGVLAVILILINYKDIFRTGFYLLDGLVDNKYVKGFVSLIYLAILVVLIILTFK